MADAGATGQTPCAAGTYQPAAGSTACIPAPRGAFVRGDGGIAFRLCPRGQFAPTVGLAACRRAKKRFYVPTAGAVAQLRCPKGTTTRKVGSRRCVKVKRKRARSVEMSVPRMVGPLGVLRV